MAVPQTVPIHRLSFEDVLAMVEAGIIGETDHVELENGVLVEMEPSGGSHANRVEWLTRHFVRALGDEYAVRVQSTFLIPDGGFYEPDLIVARPTGDELPRTGELVVEVAFSSRRRDDEKAATYAAAGVREYWIVDVQAGEVITHADL
ncbi:MAG: Uma2 family endonuclease, partial [Solirubrobacterales bacterium]|nr:Uma2 family endonuclease [Solirubrobacterales bacterium]